MRKIQLTAAGLALALMLIMGWQMAFAQGIITGSLSGTVVDSTGAIIAKANVTAKQVETNATFDAVTNDTGYFAFPKLPPGKYDVTVQAPNFRTLKVNGTEVLTARETALNKIAMQIGGKAETVEVTGAAPLIETQSAQLSMTFDSKKVQDLPIGRGIDQLAMFLPGVATAGSVGRGNNNGSLFSANGQRPRSNNFQIDGQGMNDASVTGPSIFLANPDIVAEYQVMTNYDASYGRNTGSQVNVITKSGTNAFHGTASYAWRGSTFDSLRNQEKNVVLNPSYCLPNQDPATTGCTQPRVPRYVRNTPSFAVGGPILKNKAWFFGSGVWDRIRTAGSVTSSGSALTPTANGISQAASYFPGSGGVGFLQSPFGPINTAGNPTVTRVAATGTAAQIAQADPLGTGYKTIPVCVGGGMPYFNGTTLTTVCNTTGTSAGTIVPGAVLRALEAGQVNRQVSSVTNVAQYTARGDVQLTSRDRVFGRYIYDHEPSTNLDYGDGPAGFFEDVPSKGQQIGVDWTRQWSNTMLNQVRFNWTKLDLTFGDGTTGCNYTDPSKCPMYILLSDSNVLSMGMQNSMPQARFNTTYEVQDNANWTRGSHSFKWGGDWSHQVPDNFFLPNYNGTWTYANMTTFLTNTPAQMSGANGSYETKFIENDLAFYFQDDIRLRSNFTLTAGLRWEWYQQTMNQLHDNSVAQQTGPNPYWNTSLPLSQTTIHQIPEDYNNFGPILGFAWNSTSKMVVRGGFRVAYDPSFYNIQLNIMSAAPYINSTTLVAANNQVVPLMPGSGFTGAQTRPQFQGSLPVGTDPGLRAQSLVSDNFHSPYSEQWNLGVQYEIDPKAVLEVRYLGNHGVGLFQNLPGNVALNQYNNSVGNFTNFIPSGLTPCTTANAPGSNLGYYNCNNRNITLRANTAGSNYNGLQTRFDLRSYHGVTATLSYTWAHAIDNASDIYSTAAAGMLNLPQNPFDYGNGERGSSNFDYRHTVGLQLLYDIPFYSRQEGVLGKILGGWQSNVIYRYATGQPWTPIETRSTTYFNGATTSPTNSINLCDTSNYSTSTDLCRPIVSNPNAPFNTVGYITGITNGVPTVLNMVGNTPTLVQNVHWLVNNVWAAKYFGNPYLGTQRNNLIGQPTQAVNFAMQKNVKLTERFTFQFRATAFNVLNHMFLGVPNNNIMLAATRFGNTNYNNSGGGNANTVESGIDRRRLEFGGKIIF